MKKRIKDKENCFNVSYKMNIFVSLIISIEQKERKQQRSTLTKPKVIKTCRTGKI